MQIPFATGSYMHSSRNVNYGRVLNMYAEKEPPEAYSQVALISCPGQVMYADIGNVRCQYLFRDKIYAVGDVTLYEIAPYGSEGTPVALGTIPGTGVCTITHNGIDLAVCNGDQIYFYGEDDGFRVANEQAIAVTGMDSYFIAIQRENTFTYAGPLSTTFDPLDIASNESDPDYNQAIISDHAELIMAGDVSIEIFYNSGDAELPWTRSQSARIEKGVRGQMSKLDNTVFFVGNDGVVYRLDGHNPVRISDHALEQKIGARSPSKSFAYYWNGHPFYALTFAGCGTIVYDVAANRWHNRKTWGSDIWLANNALHAFDKVILGTRNGLQYLDDEVCTENGLTIEKSFPSSMLNDDGNLRKISYLEILGDWGHGVESGIDPQVMMRYSDDGGYTWSNERWASVGKVGLYKNRARFTRLGQARERMFEMTCVNDIRFTVMKLTAGIS